VAIYAISASLKLGDPRTAAETGGALDLAAMPAGLVGRRTQLNLDLACAYAMTRKDAAAVNLLLAAERLSPQLVRYDPATRDVLTELLRREHRPSTPELRPLARRAGVICPALSCGFRARNEIPVLYLHGAAGHCSLCSLASSLGTCGERREARRGGTSAQAAAGT